MRSTYDCRGLGVQPAVKSGTRGYPFASYRPRKRRRLTSLNRSRLGKPFVESHLSEARVAFGNERPFGYLCAVVSGLRVANYFSRIFVRGQTVPDKFIEAELFRAPDFHDAMHR